MSAKHDDAGGYPRDVYMDRRKRAERRERDRADGERRAGEARSVEGTEAQRFGAALGRFDMRVLDRASVAGATVIDTQVLDEWLERSGAS